MSAPLAPAVNLASVLATAHLAAGNGPAIALIGQEGPCTFTELHNRIQAIAGWMVTRGVARGDRVVLHLPNSIDMVAGWLATQWIGALPVAVPPAVEQRGPRRRGGRPQSLLKVSFGLRVGSLSIPFSVRLHYPAVNGVTWCSEHCSACS